MGKEIKTDAKHSPFLSFNISELCCMHENKFDDLESDFLYSNNDSVFWITVLNNVITNVSTYDISEYEEYISNNDIAFNQVVFDTQIQDAKALYDFYKSKLMEMIKRDFKH